MAYSYDRMKTAGSYISYLDQEFKALVENKDVEGLLRAEAQMVRDLRKGVQGLEGVLGQLNKAVDLLPETDLPDPLLQLTSKNLGDGASFLHASIRGYLEALSQTRRFAISAETWFTQTILSMNPEKARVMFNWPRL